MTNTRSWFMLSPYRISSYLHASEKPDKLYRVTVCCCGCCVDHILALGTIISSFSLPASTWLKVQREGKRWAGGEVCFYSGDSGVLLVVVSTLKIYTSIPECGKMDTLKVPQQNQNSYLIIRASTVCTVQFLKMFHYNWICNNWPNTAYVVGWMSWSNNISIDPGS